MSRFTINKKQVAYLLGCDERTLTAYQKRAVDPLPIMKHGVRGQKNEYDPHAVYKWKLRQVLAKQQSGSGMNTESEKARLIKEQADLIALKNAKLKGEVLDRKEVEIVVKTAMTTLASQLEAIPGRCAHIIAGISNPAIVRRELQKEIRNCRTNMSEQLRLLSITRRE